MGAHESAFDALNMAAPTLVVPILLTPRCGRDHRCEGALLVPGDVVNAAGKEQIVALNSVLCLPLYHGQLAIALEEYTTDVGERCVTELLADRFLQVALRYQRVTHGGLVDMTFVDQHDFATIDEVFEAWTAAASQCQGAVYDDQRGPGGHGTPERRSANHCAAQYSTQQDGDTHIK